MDADDAEHADDFGYDDPEGIADFGYDDPGGIADDVGGVDSSGRGVLPSSPSLLERLQHLGGDASGHELLSDDGGAPLDYDGPEPEGDERDVEWEALSESYTAENSGGEPSSTENDTSIPGPEDATSPTSLEGLHVGLGGKTLEGGSTYCTFNTKADRSPFYPYENLSVMLLFLFVHKYQVSEAMLNGLLAILRTRHNDQGFEVDDIRGVTAKHFYSRRRSHHPLLEVVETMVPTKEGGTSVPCYTIPINLLLARKMQSPSFIEMCVQNPGGKVLSEDEAEQNRLSSHHLFAVPTEPLGNALSTSMHGALARSSAYFGVDGLLGARTGGRKVFINDVGMFTIGGATLPCRLLNILGHGRRGVAGGRATVSLEEGGVWC